MCRIYPFTRLWALLVIVMLLDGCSANTWREAPLRDKAAAETALVTFVRPAVFLGDNVDTYLWDGNQFIGALGAGTVLQYETRPGEHLFVGNGKTDSWAYVKADLQAGKQYILKMKVYPNIFSAGVGLNVVPRSDNRVNVWLLNLKPVVTLPEKQSAYSAEKQNAVDAAIKDFNSSKTPSFVRMVPEDGR